MVKAIDYFAKSLEITFKLFAKGKFLVFFIPGLIISIGYWYWTSGPSWLGETASATNEIPLIGGILSSMFSFMDGIMDKIYEITYQFVLLVLLSPVNTILSQKLDTHLTGRTFESGWIEFINDLLRALLIVFIAIILEYTFIALYFFIGIFIPGFIESFLDPLMYFVITAFFIGLSFYDYSLERYRIGIGGTIGYGFSKMSYMILSGSVFLLLLKVPYVGIIVAPTITTMLTTLMYLHRENKLTTKSESENDANNGSI